MPIAQAECHRARFGQCRVLAILAVLGARAEADAPVRGSGWLRALGCPSLCAVAQRSRGRWADGASGGGSGLRML
jgi:hypothetical protein